MNGMQKRFIAKRIAFLMVIVLLCCSFYYFVFAFNSDYKNETQVTNDPLPSEVVLIEDENEIEQKEEVCEETEENALDVLYIDSIPLPQEWQQYVFDLCKGSKVDAALIFAMAECESGFNPKAIGVDGKDIGLMQIRTINHDWINDKLGYELDYTNEFDSVLAAYTILEPYANKYGSVNEILMAYNMGETGAKRAWKKGIYSTQYTEKVMKAYEKYNNALKGEVND